MAGSLQSNSGMLRRAVWLATLLLPPAAPAQAGRTVMVGGGVIFGPGPVTQGERLTARLLDGAVVRLAVSWDVGRVVPELGVLVPLAELDVRDAAGERYPHHATSPLVWNAGMLLSPFSSALSPFVAGGWGGLLAAADLDNTGGPTWYHPWQWSLGAGLRLSARGDEAGGLRALELRVIRVQLLASGPWQARHATAVTVTFGFTL